MEDTLDEILVIEELESKVAPDSAINTVFPPGVGGHYPKH